MPIANEYEALTPEASAVVDDFVEVFKLYVSGAGGYRNNTPRFTIRELCYLANQGIDLAASETTLRNAMAKRKQERQESNES